MERKLKEEMNKTSKKTQAEEDKRWDSVNGQGKVSKKERVKKVMYLTILFGIPKGCMGRNKREAFLQQEHNAQCTKR